MRNESGRADAWARSTGPTTTGPIRVDIEQLRAYMWSLRQAIIEHPVASLEQQEAQWRIEEITDELDQPEPSAPRVKARWIKLAPLVGTLRPDVPLPEVNELVNGAL